MRINKITKNKKMNTSTAKKLLSLICTFALVVTMVVPTCSYYSFAEDDSSSAEIAELGGQYVNVSISSDKETYEPGDTAEFSVVVTNDTDKAIDEETAKNIVMSPYLSDETFEISDEAPGSSAIDAKGGTLKTVFKVSIPETVEEFSDMFAVKLSCEGMDEEFTNLLADEGKTVYAPLTVAKQEEKEEVNNSEEENKDISSEENKDSKTSNISAGIRKLARNLLGAGEPTGIKVSKEISGLDPSRSFSFTATISGGTFTEPAAGAGYTLNSAKTVATFTLKGGEEVFLPAPEGATINVSETAGNDYNVVFRTAADLSKDGSIDVKVGKEVTQVIAFNGSNTLDEFNHSPLVLDLDAEAGKKIDYLGDNDGTTDKDNPDTTLDDNGIGGLKDMYRLYLDLKAKSEKSIDLLLVIDQSGSMGSKDNYATRQQPLLDFLNGANGEDGFVKRFLEANENNNIAAVTFAEDSTDANYVMPWTDDADSINLGTPKAGTNYTAGLYMADKILDSAPGIDNEKIVIFLGDGGTTYAYTDGKLQNGASDLLRFGNGQENFDALKIFVDAVLDSIDNGLDYVEGFNKSKIYNGKLTGDSTRPPYPTSYYAVNAINIPGVEIGDDGKLTITDNTAANKFSEDYWDADDQGELENFIKQYIVGDVSNIRTFDLFERTEAAADEFRKANPDVALYTIGFSSDLSGTDIDGYGNTRSVDEVLDYMASTGKDNNTDYKGEYYYAVDGAALADSFNSILFMRNIVLTDTLSDYVDAADNKELKVVLTDESGKETVLYTESAGITDESILESVSYDSAKKALQVKFNPSYPMSSKDKITASFNVKVNEAAYAKYDELGKAYSDNGDKDTDYADNATSSLKDGFFSNKEAKLTWTTGSPDKDGNYNTDSVTYPKPVVQVAPRVCAKIVKTDGKTKKPLADAQFTIFVDDGDGVYDADKDTEKALTYTSDTLAVQGDNPLVTDADGIAAFYGLVEDKLYWIVETQAPEGYILIKDPKSFKFIGEGTAEVDGKTVSFTDGICELAVENFPLYNLPNVGGSGIMIYMFIGSLAAAFAVMRSRKKKITE